MKTPAVYPFSPSRCLLVLFAVAMFGLPATRAQDTAGADQSIPLIKLENVPLTDAIRNLARTSGLNYILDPRLAEPWPGSDGKPGREPAVNVRWENLTAYQALARLMEAHGLTLVTNPVTAIARIGFTNAAIKPVPASAVGKDTNAPIPLIVMEDVPLTVALHNLAAQAHYSLEFEPESPRPGGKPVREPMVSVRWEKVTARQAIAALLDNYDLALVPVSGGSSLRVTVKAKEH